MEKPPSTHALQSMPQANLAAAGLSSLRLRERDIIFDGASGISRSLQRMFNHAIAVVAAFGFVAFVVVFVHPAPPATRAAARQMSAGSEVAASDAAVAGVRPHLAASK
jgi:hypothetical protein